MAEKFFEAGTAKFEYRYLTLSGFDPGSSQAALAAECAADQNAFWPFHDKIFEAAAAEDQAGVTFDRLLGYATDMGLDTNVFTRCMGDPETAQRILEIRTAGIEQGVRSTPSVIINGKLMDDAFDIDALVAEIDGLLSGN